MSIKGDNVSAFIYTYLKQQWSQLHIVCLQKTMIERIWVITNFICISHKLISSFFFMSKYMYAKMLWYELFQLTMPLLVVFEQLDLSQELSQYG